MPDRRDAGASDDFPAGWHAHFVGLLPLARSHSDCGPTVYVLSLSGLGAGRSLRRGASGRPTKAAPGPGCGTLAGPATTDEDITSDWPHLARARTRLLLERGPAAAGSVYVLLLVVSPDAGDVCNQGQIGVRTHCRLISVLTEARGAISAPREGPIASRRIGCDAVAHAADDTPTSSGAAVAPTPRADHARVSHGIAAPNPPPVGPDMGPRKLQRVASTKARAVDKKSGPSVLISEDWPSLAQANPRRECRTGRRHVCNHVVPPGKGIAAG